MLLTAFSARRFINVTDDWQELEDRIGQVVDPGRDAADVLEELYQTAQKTRNPMKDVSEAFLENARTISNLGGSTQEALNFTTSLSAALDASGQRGDRARAITNALADAMRMGQLRGNQLNTVVRAGGNVAENLADHLKVAVIDLKAMGDAGKITADDIRRALVDNMERNVADATAGVFSFRDGWVFVNNAIDRWIANAGKATGTSYRLGQALKWAGENIETLIAAAAGIAAAFGIAKLIDGLKAVGGAVAAIKGAWTGVAGAGALVFAKFVAIAAAVLFVLLAAQDVYTWLNRGDSVLGRLVGSSEKWKEKLDAIARPAKRIWDRIKRLGDKLGEIVTSITNFGSEVLGLEESFENVGEVIETAFGGALDAVAFILEKIDDAITKIVEGIEMIKEGAKWVAEKVPGLSSGPSEPYNHYQPVLSPAELSRRAVAIDNDLTVNQYFNNVPSPMEAARESLEGIRRERARMPSAEAAP